MEGQESFLKSFFDALKATGSSHNKPEHISPSRYTANAQSALCSRRIFHNTVQGSIGMFYFRSVEFRKYGNLMNADDDNYDGLL